MDKQVAGGVAVVLLIAAAMFYPPLASLLGEGARALLGVGASFAGIYLTLRYPWRVGSMAVAFGSFFLTIYIAAKVGVRYGPFAGTASWMGSLFLVSKLMNPVIDWMISKDRNSQKS